MEVDDPMDIDDPPLWLMAEMLDDPMDLD